LYDDDEDKDDDCYDNYNYGNDYGGDDNDDCDYNDDNVKRLVFFFPRGLSFKSH